MAEAMLLGVAKSVLGQLSSPALEEALLVWDFEKDLKRLGETIETITCVIHDAEQRPSNQHAVKLWLSRLKVVLYDADDLFDAIAARALRKKAMDGSAFKKEVTLFFSKSNQLAFVIKTAHDIKDIRECLDGIKDDMSQFQFQYQRIEENLSHRVLEREERHSFVDSNAVIGRDQENEDIINLLLAENTRQRSFEVISVIGFGGLGKTTLAQLVYNDERVQKGFDLCLWSCINYFSDLQSVLVKILESKPHELHLNQLQKMLREKIGGKKYLLVLDDVWDDNLQNWGRLETLLACGKIGSKVLITTRKVGVAKCLEAVEPFYNLSLLSEESAWSLFVKVVFKDEGFVGDSELDSLGKQIIRKCGCVPLLVSLIGGLLGRRKKDSEVWLSFLEKEFAGVVAGNTDDGHVMQVLKVSYNDLPAALRRCFAYCSIFPEDHEFDKGKLLRMWIAQGFVEPVAGKSLEEVGDDYFFSMIDACFFQEVEVEEYGFGVVNYTCKMHDLLHELATQVAGSESIRYTHEDSQNMAHLRHICITPPFSNSLSLFQNLSSCSKSLRSLVTTDDIEINSLKLVLEKFRNLRTLVLPYMNHTTLPDSFGGLIHLRYLDLSRNDVLIALPKSICKLHHLQTLSLTHCPSLVNFPTTFKKLVSLRHLFLKGCSKLDSMPSGFAGLTSLVSLDWFIMHPGRGGLSCLQGLDKLCGMLKLELPMNGWPDCVEDAKMAKMASKGKLSGLSITWRYNSESDGEDLGGEKAKAVLEQLQPHVNLRYLEIKRYTSDKLPRWFSSLSNLKKLNLSVCWKVEYLDESVRCDWLLPHLEVLELGYMDCLRGWRRGATSTVQRMPRVTKLVIECCMSLVENMPLFYALEDLTLSWVNVKLVNMLLSCPNIKLQVLSLTSIEGLECLPEGLIKHLTALKDLEILYCWDLGWISRRGLACLTSLERLRITSDREVRLEDEDDDNKMRTEISNNMYRGLQRLCYLIVDWHPDMYYGLHFLTSLQELVLIYYEEQQVEADNRNSECRTSAPEKLQSVELSFEGMRKCCFPKWTLNLPCLQELKLRDCGEMNVADWVAQQTQSTTLVTLRIHSHRDEESLWVQNIPWNLLPSLRTLVFRGKLSSIPDGIQHLTSLQHLKLWDCQNLGEIPKWMIKLTSLQELAIYECSPELIARCTPQTGADWHLISHIPTVYIASNAHDPEMESCSDPNVEDSIAAFKDTTLKSGLSGGDSLSNQTEDLKPYTAEVDSDEVDIQSLHEPTKEVQTGNAHDPETESWSDSNVYDGIAAFIDMTRKSGVPGGELQSPISPDEVTPTSGWKEYQHTPHVTADEHLHLTLGVGFENQLNQGTDDNNGINKDEAKKLLFLFSEGYEFEKKMLIQLWMALGLLPDEPMEENGAYYFENLVSEGYILCSVPNSLYKVNLERLGIEDRSIIKLDSTRRNSGSSTETLHASVVCDEINSSIFQTLRGFSRLRTLLFLGSYGSRLHHIPRDLFLCYESLEALDLSGTHIKELPSSAGKMINLRYLDLSWTLLEALPEKIDRFKKLQTLKLEGCSRLHRLPDETKGLTNLRHLHLDVLSELTAFPEGMGALVNVRTLSGFPVGTEQGLRISELKYLDHITGSFCIAKIENVQSADVAKEALLNNKKNIKKLKLRWSNPKIQHPKNEAESILQNLCPCSDVEEIQIVCYPGIKLPDWIADVSFDKLVSITLFGCVRVNMLPSIGKLPSLASLELISLNGVTDMDFKGVAADYVAFPKLQKLSVDGMLSLQTWEEAEKGDYPCLLELSIKDCPKLRQFPSVVYVPILEHLEVSGCSSLALVSDERLSVSLEQLTVENCPLMEDRCCKDRGEDWHKIQHVPIIWVNEVAIQSIENTA